MASGFPCSTNGIWNTKFYFGLAIEFDFGFWCDDDDDDETINIPL